MDGATAEDTTEGRWSEEAWLVAVTAEESEWSDDEVRRWWNLKDGVDRIDAIIAASSALRLGILVTTGAEPEPPGPIRRVHDLLYLRGTSPEPPRPPYVLPLLDDTLAAEILAAFRPRPGDDRRAESALDGHLSHFLDRHRGARIVVDSRPPGVR